MTRICITTNDIQIITGKSERQCRNILKDIKLLLKKEKHQLVTIDELANYLAIDRQIIINVINNPTKFVY
jgi:ribosomal silencing factor RsfS